MANGNVLENLQFIHSIIDSVDRSPEFGYEQQVSDQEKHRRARQLTSGAVRVLRVLQDELIALEWAQYEAAYEKAKAQVMSTSDDALYAAEGLWNFAVLTAREVDWRSTSPKRPRRPQIASVQPTSWLMTPVAGAPIVLPSPPPSRPTLSLSASPSAHLTGSWTASPVFPPTTLPWPWPPTVVLSPIILSPAAPSWQHCQHCLYTPGPAGASIYPA